MPLRVAIGPSSFASPDRAPLDLLEARGIEVVPNSFGRRLTEEEIIAHLADVDGLVAGLEPLNRRVLAGALPRLRAVSRVGIGMTNVDQPAAAELGIKVSNTPDPPARAVAELTLGAMLALARGLVATNEAFHAGQWPKSVSRGLDEATVLIVGFGRIGREVAARLRPFGARILVCDPFADPASLHVDDRLVALAEGLAAADVVTLHASGERCIIGADELAHMRPGAFLLNSARGGLVDESALLAALDSGRLAGAWFDAFWKEPYTGALLRYPQVLLTPHAGTYTARCRLRMETEAVANLLRDLGVA